MEDSGFEEKEGRRRTKKKKNEALDTTTRKSQSSVLRSKRIAKSSMTLNGTLMVMMIQMNVWSVWYWISKK